MPFSNYRTCWKLRPDVQVPYAHREEELEQVSAEPAAAPAAETAAAPVQQAEPQPQSQPQQAAPEMQTAVAAAASSEPAAAPAGREQGPQQLPVYISEGLRVSYLDGLKSYLKKQGVVISDFRSGDRPRPPALILLAPGDLPPPGCICFPPDENKKFLWSFLKKMLEPVHA